MQSTFPPAATRAGFADDGDPVTTPQRQLVGLECEVIVQSVAVANHARLVIHCCTCISLTPEHYRIVPGQLHKQP